MKRRRRHSRGQTIWLFALGVVVFFAFLAFVIDWGRLFFTRQKLRNHCDACALAGAQNLPSTPDPLPSKQKATEYWAKNVSLTPGDIAWQGDTGNTSRYRIGIDDVYVTTPYSDAKLSDAGIPPQNAIEVKGWRLIHHHIGTLLGFPAARVPARAVAIIGSPSSVDGQKDQVIPVGYPTSKPPDFDSQTESPWVDPSTWAVGNEYPLNLKGDGVHGNEYFVALGGNGGSVYRDNWKFGAQGDFGVGDIVQTEPGVKNGPTDQGVNFRVDQCPSATWDKIPEGCPRVVTMLLVDPTIDDYKGRSDVKIVGFARWFVQPYDGSRKPEDPVKTVRAIFMSLTIGGSGLCRTCPVFNMGHVALVE